MITLTINSFKLWKPILSLNICISLVPAPSSIRHWWPHYGHTSYRWLSSVHFTLHSANYWGALHTALHLVIGWFHVNTRRKKVNVKNKSDAKNGKNHIISLYSFIFLHKNVTFRHWPFFLVLTWNHPIQNLGCSQPIWKFPHTGDDYPLKENG